MKIHQVSVIILVYIVERFFEKCLRSLFEQTLDNIEYVFINDCTPDNSMLLLNKVLEEYPNRKHQVQIVNHEHNKRTWFYAKRWDESSNWRICY